MDSGNDDRSIGFLALGGRPALAHLAAVVAAAVAALVAGLVPPALTDWPAERGATLYNATVRKREAAYLLPLDAAHAGAIERASYDASYKGVTDLLHLVRLRQAWTVRSRRGEIVSWLA